MASVSVEGRKSPVDVEDFSDLPVEPLVLSHSDLGVIHGVMVTGGRGVFHDGRVGMFAISMLMEPGAEHSGHLTNVFLVTVTAFYTVYHPTLFLLHFLHMFHLLFHILRF